MKLRYLAVCMLVAATGCDVPVEGDERPDDALAAAEAPHAERGPHELTLEDSLERWEREFAGDFGEPLEQFAAKCDMATGITVPDFKCSQGALVPTTNHANGKCDRPNRLNQECDPGSRFQVVAQSPDAVAVAHCRRRGLSGNNYADVAVIQYNKVNGAVCFYQALGVLDGDFKAPTKGTSLAGHSNDPNPAASPWFSTSATKAIDCAGCHDNGALIRSPYITQMATMPGRGDSSYNRNQPVSFIGDDFQDWELHQVKIPGNTCDGCHRLGVTDSQRTGTAARMAQLATAASEPAKNPHSATSPMWMLPGQIAFSPTVAAQAAQYKVCADKWRAGVALPAGCTVTRFSTEFQGMTPALAVVSIR